MDNLVETKRKRTQRDYTMGFKMAVVDQVEKGQMTYKQAQRCYGIQGRSTVLEETRKKTRKETRKKNKKEDTHASAIVLQVSGLYCPVDAGPAGLNWPYATT